MKLVKLKDGILLIRKGQEFTDFAKTSEKSVVWRLSLDILYNFSLELKNEDVIHYITFLTFDNDYSSSSESKEVMEKRRKFISKIQVLLKDFNFSAYTKQ